MKKKEAWFFVQYYHGDNRAEMFSQNIQYTELETGFNFSKSLLEGISRGHKEAHGVDIPTTKVIITVLTKII